MKLAIAVLVLALCLGASAQSISGVPPLAYTEGSIVLEEDFLGGSLSLCWRDQAVTGFFSDFGLLQGTKSDAFTISGNVYTAGANGNTGTFSMNLVVNNNERYFTGAISGLQSSDIAWTWTSSNPRITSVDDAACWTSAFGTPSDDVSGTYQNRQYSDDGSYTVISSQYICTDKNDATKIYGSWFEPGHKYYIEADLVDSFVQADVWRYDILNGNQVKNGALYQGSGLFVNNNATLSGFVWNDANVNVTSADDEHHWIELTRYLQKDNTYPSASSSNCNKYQGLTNGKVGSSPLANYDFSTPFHKEEDFETYNHPYVYTSN